MAMVSYCVTISRKGPHWDRNAAQDVNMDKLEETVRVRVDIKTRRAIDAKAKARRWKRSHLIRELIYLFVEGKIDMPEIK
jgi:hypothetical protein